MMANLSRLSISDLLLMAPHRFGDHRGWFMETFHKQELADNGFVREFVQDNHSLSGAKGTVRGLHFQAPPHAQDKLVRVIRGSIIDVAVDIRKKSPTFGKHVSIELSAENNLELLIPTGFAHGFQTLIDSTEVLYKVTDYYEPIAEGGLLWNDPALGIAWPFPDTATVNSRDAAWPSLAELQTPFQI